MNMLGPISARSKDPNTQIGCIIAGPDHNIRSTGYNSLPRGVNDDLAERYERPAKYKWIEHADRNAIYAAARVGTPLLGCSMYLSGIPCMDCGRGIIQVGISEVIYDHAKQLDWETRTPQYLEDFLMVRVLLDEANVMLTPWRAAPAK
jgi:dCMP deaminase